MKKSFSILMAAAMALSFTACNSGSIEEPEPPEPDRSVTEAADTTETVPSSEPETSLTSTEGSETDVTTATTEATTTTTTTTAATTTITTTAAATTTTTTAATTTTTTSATTTTAAATTTTTAAAPAASGSTFSLSNPNASPEAVSLFGYICEVYGDKIISGQQESTWMGSDQYEFEYIYRASGKYPAIRGLDYMNDDFSGVNRRARDWYSRGGIVTICWHCGSDFSGSWAESMETTITDWDKALTEGTSEYNKLISGMDKAAKALQELRDAGIPVLWRPFHEFDGAWFWWGKGGADNFIKLWHIMYDRYTNYWKLDNLIWVLGYSGSGSSYAKWYPGDEYVDIAGADSYSTGANAKLYNAVVKAVDSEKPVCYHECGANPTVKQLRDSEAGWVWFMTWHTSQLTDNNSADALKELYNDDYVITLDELPKELYHL